MRCCVCQLRQPADIRRDHHLQSFPQQPRSPQCQSPGGIPRRGTAHNACAAVKHGMRPDARAIPPRCNPRVARGSRLPIAITNRIGLTQNTGRLTEPMFQSCRYFLGKLAPQSRDSQDRLTATCGWRRLRDEKAEHMNRSSDSRSRSMDFRISGSHRNNHSFVTSPCAMQTCWRMVPAASSRQRPCRSILDAVLPGHLRDAAPGEVSTSC